MPQISKTEALAFLAVHKFAPVTADDIAMFPDTLERELVCWADDRDAVVFLDPHACTLVVIHMDDGDMDQQTFRLGRCEDDGR